jgi:hypothetical protein
MKDITNAESSHTLWAQGKRTFRRIFLNFYAEEADSNPETPGYNGIACLLATLILGQPNGNIYLAEQRAL